MLQESNVSRNSSYLVPCVFKAVHLIEALRETGAGLSVENFRGMTGYSRTTIYRILRTLAACGYIIRSSGGVYRLNYSVITAAGGESANEEGGGKFVLHVKPGKSHVAEFERWGIRFRGNGARMGTDSSGPQAGILQSRNAGGSSSCET
jgi:biotin operon repressor